MVKAADVLEWRRQHRLRAPVLLSVTLLTAARARWFDSVRLPGVILPRDLRDAVTAEQRMRDRGRAAAYRRLAMQIVGAERLGYAGFLLVGMQDERKIARLMAEVDRVRGELPSDADRWLAREGVRGQE
jgi:methylenetetrahydrofolate reductase (NADPH)